MLKIEMNGKEAEISTYGTVPELINELGIAIRCIHASMEQRDPASAAAFRFVFTAMVADPASHMWTMDPAQIGNFASMGGVIKKRQDND